MKYLSKILLAIGFITAFSACKKLAEVPFSPNGKAVVLSVSTNMVTTAVADSAKNVISFSWTNPKYAQDPSLYKYVLEIDSTGRNFSGAYKLVITGVMDTTLKGKQFNDILAQIGVLSGVSSSVDVRVTSSYGNNNEAYTSNVITVKATPYIVPLAMSASSLNPLTLLINNAGNSAVIFNWNATQYGNYNFEYRLQLDTVGGKFAKPQEINVNGGLKKDLSIGDLNTIVLLAGATAGKPTEIEFRVAAFQTGNATPSVLSNVIKITVTPYLPFLYLWLPGDYQNWSPDVAPQVGATVPNLNDFEGYVNVPAGGTYKFKFTNAPDWNHTGYGGGAGVLDASGPDLTWPDGANYYYVKANPVSLTWSAIPVTWSIIGDGTPGGWNNDTPMTYDAVNKVWVINSVPLTANLLKFRVTGEWNLNGFPNNNSNLGGSLNSLSYGGDNISIPSTGNYKIVLDLSHPLKYTATLTKL